jgi:hypothetical protein
MLLVWFVWIVLLLAAWAMPQVCAPVAIITARTAVNDCADRSGWTRDTARNESAGRPGPAVCADDAGRPDCAEGAGRQGQAEGPGSRDCSEIAGSAGFAGGWLLTVLKTDKEIRFSVSNRGANRQGNPIFGF